MIRLWVQFSAEPIGSDVVNPGDVFGVDVNVLAMCQVAGATDGVVDARYFASFVPGPGHGGGVRSYGQGCPLRYVR